MLLTGIPTLDRLLHAHRAELAGDYTAYRNHAYRVANLCVALTSDDSARVEKIATAAAYHDMGIWTDGTFDYLAPSVRLARAHLQGAGREAWVAEITEMISQHHKVSAYRRRELELVEPFRRADWVDVSKGLVTFGLRRQLVDEIFSTWPNAGFHKRLVRLELGRLRRRPWSPLPMVKL